MYNQRKPIPTISVNGKETPAKIGDSNYFISFGSRDDKYGVPEIRHGEQIAAIMITMDGEIQYYNNDDSNICIGWANDGQLWSEEAAQEWIDKYVPKEYVYKQNDVKYIIEEEEIVKLTAYRPEANYSTNEVCYGFTDDENYEYTISNAGTEEEIAYNGWGVEFKTYDSYEDAEKALKEQNIEK